jgi:hypothetical protein
VATHLSTRAVLRRTALLAGLALLSVVTAASGCGGKGAGGGDPLKLLPTDSSMVIEVNVARLRQTQFKDRLLQLRDRSETLKKGWDNLVQKSGLDPMRDIDHIALGLPYQPQSSDMGVVIIGRFNQNGIVTWFKGREGAKVKEEKRGQYTVYFDEEKNYYLTFPSSTVLMLGSKDWIGKMLELADGKGQSVRTRPDMADLINRRKPNQVVWLVARFPKELMQRAKESDSAFKGVTGLIADVDFAAGMELQFQAETEADADAARLTEKFNSMVKELRESPLVGALALAPMLNDVKGTQQGKVFTARATLPQQPLDDLIKKVEDLVKQKMNEMPRFQFPSPAEGGPQVPSSQPEKPDPSGAAEPKTPPPGVGEMPKLQLTPPGATKEKRRPGLLGP